MSIIQVCTPSHRKKLLIHVMLHSALAIEVIQMLSLPKKIAIWMYKRVFHTSGHCPASITSAAPIWHTHLITIGVINYAHKGCPWDTPNRERRQCNEYRDIFDSLAWPLRSYHPHPTFDRSDILDSVPNLKGCWYYNSQSLWKYFIAMDAFPVSVSTGSGTRNRDWEWDYFSLH